ncbi:hypothetical protein [Streptomyces sp. NPDC056549]|uniref:hypothetical protein n=1 Tax=Streptomyces sp. NPDC056549 TaxID=3345864 RepID=UPI00369131CC
MELKEWAGPRIEEHADKAADAASQLADIAVPGGWSTAADDDALAAIETLAETLGGIGPQIAETLPAMTAANLALS